jgi:hypothetical protein
MPCASREGLRAEFTDRVDAYGAINSILASPMPGMHVVGKSPIPAIAAR